jgi:hypothetical protein
MYKLVKDSYTNENTIVQRTTDGSFIPFDPANRHYQEYLAWLAEGNEPEPADD